MTRKKRVPCAPFDIPGMQEWLDEMARQGLFLQEFTWHHDRAIFELGDPKPVRYRLDPVNKGVHKDKDREEPYAQMGWSYVTRYRQSFYIFSCDDPEAPELYSDPQSLAMAMGDLIRRSTISIVLYALLFLFIAALPLILFSPRSIQNLLLWERPQDLVFSFFYPILLLICLPLLAMELKRLKNIRNTLAQGLPLKAKRRRYRPSYPIMYISIYLIMFFGPRLLLPKIGWQVHDLEEAQLSHPWPTLTQTEAAGPHPLKTEPSADGYTTDNRSWFAPVQESAAITWEVRIPSTPVPRAHSYWTKVRYVQGRSLKIAELLYRLERDAAAENLDNWTDWNGLYHLIDLQPFQPQDWPGLDQLEVARYTRWGRGCWTLAARRGVDILVVDYVGCASWEDCLPLFLEALGEEAAL